MIRRIVGGLTVGGLALLLSCVTVKQETLDTPLKPVQPVAPVPQRPETLEDTVEAVPREDEVANLYERKRLNQLYQSAIRTLQQAENEKDKKKRNELATKAYDLFKQVKEADSHAALLKQAECLTLKGENERALYILQEEIEKNPTAEAYNHLGKVQVNLSLYLLARRSFTKAIRKEDKPVYRWNRHAANFLTNNLHGALEDLNVYIKARPDNPDAYVAKAGTLIAIAKGNRDIITIAHNNLGKALKLIKQGKRFTFYDAKNVWAMYSRTSPPGQEFY